jgi:hypothetical protein
MIILTRPGAGLPEEGGVNEACYSINEPLWCTTVRDRVSKELFDDMQFITCDEQESYGSEWQQEVCERAGKSAWNGLCKSLLAEKRKGIGKKDFEPEKTKY